MHAWLISSSSARAVQILKHSALPLTHAQAWGDAHTAFQEIASSLLGLKQRPLWKTDTLIQSQVHMKALENVSTQI